MSDMPLTPALKIRKLSLFGSDVRQGRLPAVASLAASLLNAGFELEICSDFDSHLRRCGINLHNECSPVESPSSDADMVVSLGGDGTFLRAAQWVASRNIPIVGVNLGHLGFLTGFGLHDTDALISALLTGNLRIEAREMIRVDAPGLPEDFSPFCLNEVAILKEDTASMICIHTEIDGYFLTDYLADGLLISTPTGTTGYNLAVGGPIAQPTLRIRTLSPIAPHTLSMRPLIVGSESEIKARVESRADYFRLSLDGRSCRLSCGTQLHIRRAEFDTLVARHASDNFASTLRNKLSWGGDSRYSEGL